MQKNNSGSLSNSLAMVFLAGYLFCTLANLFFVPKLTSPAQLTVFSSQSDLIKSYSNLHSTNFVQIIDKSTLDAKHFQSYPMWPVCLLLIFSGCGFLLMLKTLVWRRYPFYNLQYCYISFRTFRI